MTLNDELKARRTRGTLVGRGSATPVISDCLGAATGVNQTWEPKIGGKALKKEKLIKNHKSMNPCKSSKNPMKGSCDIGYKSFLAVA